VRRRTRPAVAAAFLLAAGLAGQRGGADDHGIGDCPDGPGREETANLCAACHSGRLVSQQGLTRARWEEVLEIMTVRHRMPKLEGEERELILGYLVKAFPPRGRGYDNPFLKK
jgi:hypothetical protein